MTETRFQWLNWRVRHEFYSLSKEERDEWITEAALRSAEASENNYLVMAGDLMLAGWHAEPLNPNDPMMSWRWRRPGPRGGRLFLSTDQAFNALKRASGL